MPVQVGIVVTWQAGVLTRGTQKNTGATNIFLDRGAD